MSDLMSGMGLAVWPVVALVLFVTVFVAIVARVMSKRMKAEYERAGHIPLTDDVVTPRPQSPADQRDPAQAGRGDSGHG